MELWMVRMDHNVGPTMLSLTVIWLGIDAHEYFPIYRESLSHDGALKQITCDNVSHPLKDA